MKDLNRLGDAEFLTAVSEGLSLIADNATRLAAGAEELASLGHGRASHTLEVIATEEAAKYLLLVDAVRCPTQPQSLRSRQLGRFYDHLSKGIYAQVCRGRWSTFGELQDYASSLREEFYLDGPNGWDWVFSNDVLRSREQALYVDYVDSDEGPAWWGPGGIRDDESYSRWQVSSSAVQLVEAMHGEGFSTEAALGVVAELWRPLIWERESTYGELRSRIHETYVALAAEGALAEHWRVIHDSWPFPLYSADLSKISIDLDELRRVQEEQFWSEML